MKWLWRIGALALAVHVTACGGGASGDQTTGAGGAEPPAGGGVIEQLGDNGSAPLPARNVRNVTINDVRLSDAEILDLEQRYKAQIVDANYWYDSMSGAWGLEGGPMRGVVLPGLQLGGPLKADASGTAHTGTFVNGRELHPLDVSGLNRCPGLVVQPGRFWVRPDGVGGLEGAPASFNLYAYCGGGNRGWVCDGQSCATRTVTGGADFVSEGGGQGGVYTSSGLVLTPN